VANNNIPVKIEFGGIDQISPVLGSITLRIGKLTKSTENLGLSLKKITFATMMTMGAQLNSQLQNFSSKFNGILSGSIENASNIEDNLNRVRILLDKKPSDNFLGGLNKQWKELAEVSTMSASDISDVSKDIVNSGVRKESTISQFTKLSVLLADASKRELSATEAFSLLNEFKNSFSLKAEDLPSLADKIVYARDHGTAGYSDIKEGFKYAAPTWGALTNATPDEYLAFNAELSNHGITGSVAGTALRRLPLLFTKSLDKSTLLRLEKGADADLQGTLEDFKSNKHNTILKALGIDFNSIKTNEKASNKIDLFKALKAVQLNLPKLKIEDQNAVIQQLFGQEALSTGLTAIRFMDNITNIVDLVKNHSQGKAEELANSTRNTLRSQINQTKQAWDNLKISILDSSTGESLKFITNQMKRLADHLQGLPDSMKNFVGYIGLSAYGVVELSTALAPVMMTLYFMANTFKIIAGMSLFKAIMSEIGLVITSFRTLTSLTALWNALSAVNPYVLLFMAISTAVLLVINNFDWLKAKFMDAYNYIQPKIQYLLDKIKEFYEWTTHKLGFNSQKENNSPVVQNSSLGPIQYSEKWKFPNFTKTQNSEVDIKVKFEGMPQGTKVIQKTKNAPPANFKMGYLGGHMQ
jgi:TP901 family phage tail tape measure protein